MDVEAYISPLAPDPLTQKVLEAEYTGVLQVSNQHLSAAQSHKMAMQLSYSSKIHSISWSFSHVNLDLLKAFLSIERLGQLTLVQCHMSDEGLILIAQHSNITYLDVTRNGLTDACLPALSRMAQLRSIGLNDNHLSTQAVLSFIGNSSCDVDVRGNPLDHRILDQLLLKDGRKLLYDKPPPPPPRLNLDEDMMQSDLLRYQPLSATHRQLGSTATKQKMHFDWPSSGDLSSPSSSSSSLSTEFSTVSHTLKRRSTGDSENTLFAEVSSSQIGIDSSRAAVPVTGRNYKRYKI